MKHSTDQSVTNPAVPPLLWLAIGAGIFACAFVLSQRVPMWAPGMFYGFRKPLFLPGGAFVLFFLALQAVVARGLLRATVESEAGTPAKPRRAAPWLAALCVTMLCVNLPLRVSENVGLAPMGILTINPAAGGYYVAAFDADKLDNWVRQYPQLMEGHHHVETHPPGGVALMRMLRESTRGGSILNSIAQEALLWSGPVRLEDLAGFCRQVWKRDYQGYDIAAAWWGGLIFMLCAALLPGAVYALARPLTSRSAAAHAALLIALVPSFALLSPALDMLIALCGALTLALAAHGFLKNKPLLLLLSGIVAGFGMVFSFAAAAPAVIACGFFAWQAHSGNGTWRDAVRAVALVAGGALAMVGLFAALGVNWLEIYRLTHIYQAKVMLDYNRPWQSWIFFNLVDFFFFLGLPAAVLFFGSLKNQENTPQATGLLLSTIAVLLLIHFGAKVWAESARIWMFFMPPLLVGAGLSLSRLAEKYPAATWLILAAQTAQLLAMAASLDVWSL